MSAPLGWPHWGAFERLLSCADYRCDTHPACKRRSHGCTILRLCRVLDGLRQAGMKLALASRTPTPHVANAFLDKLGLRQRFHRLAAFLLIL